MDEGARDLKRIWERQQEQQRRFYDPDRLSDEERGLILRDLLIGVGEESSELTRIIHKPLQYHIVKDRTANTARIIEESVDAFKYIMSILQMFGVGPDEFVEAFYAKTQVVDDKHNATVDHLAHESVILVDLDGCLADLEGGFRNWLYDQADCLEDPDTAEIHLPKFNHLKDRFQEEAGVANLELMYPDAVQFLNSIKAKVIIVTSRPQRRFKNMYSDTIQWLDKVGLKYHHIVFTTEKTDVIDQVRPAKILGVVEDYYKYAIPLAQAGVRVFKLPCIQDQFFSFQHENIIKVKNWGEIKHYLEEMS